MLTKKSKQRIVESVQVHEKDTGSAEVQIAILSKRIEHLSTHLKKHAKDKHSRRGLLQLVADRHAMSNYLKKKSEKRYKTLAKKVGLKG